MISFNLHISPERFHHEEKMLDFIDTLRDYLPEDTLFLDVDTSTEYVTQAISIDETKANSVGQTPPTPGSGGYRQVRFCDGDNQVEVEVYVSDDRIKFTYIDTKINKSVTYLLQLEFASNSYRIEKHICDHDSDEKESKVYSKTFYSGIPFYITAPNAETGRGSLGPRFVFGEDGDATDDDDQHNDPDTAGNGQLTSTC